MLRAADCTFTVACFDSLADCGVGEAEWDGFHIRQRAEIFHSYHWVRTWLATYGGGRTLRLFIIRRGDALAGILPVFYEDHRWFASGSRVAKQVCADFGIASLSLPIEPDALRPALEAVLNHLFRTDACDAVQFGTLIGQPEISGDPRRHRLSQRLSRRPRNGRAGPLHSSPCRTPSKPISLR